MISLDELKHHWERVNRIPNGYSQLNEKHPLAWYVGYNANLCRTLCVDVGKKFDNIKHSKALEITFLEAKNGRVRLFISLLEENLADVFINMISDLLNYSEKGGDEAGASNLFRQRFIQWEKLFKNNYLEFMSEEKQQGLIGELLFLKEKIEDKCLGKEQALDGWFGPECEHQDFYYGNNWYEIKTVKENGDKVTISSLQQLSLSDKGNLVIYMLHRCDKNNASFSLNSLVQNIYYLLEDDLNSKDAFEIKLSLYGYVERVEYDDKYYIVASRKKFMVDEHFPRLLVDTIPSAIVNAKYSLSLAALHSWEISDKT